MITFVTYNQAMMWDRMERIFVISICVLAVAFLESLGSNPTWIFTALAALGAQILVLKCWSDMLIDSKPFDNCWAFEK
jgi:hypothetical protein